MRLNLESARYMQYAAALSATLASAAFGTLTAWPSPTISKFHSENSPIGTILSDEEMSWVVSSAGLGSALGSFVTRWGVNYLGTKKTLIVSVALMLAHWFLLIFADSLALLIAGRSLGGFASGMGLPAIVIYTAEIADEDIRGKLSTYNIFMKTLGTVIVLVVGPYVSYTALGIICGCIPVVFFCCFVSMPESPFYYVKIGQKEEARKSLKRLTAKNAGRKFLDDKLAFINEVVEEDMKDNGSYVDLLTKKEYRWTLFLLFGIKSLQQFSGTSPLEAYIQPIIEASQSVVDPEVASIIIGCIQIPAVFLSSILVDRLGRKPLLITSASFCCIALLGEGTYFLIQDYFEKDTKAIGWLPTAGLALFWVTNPLGIMTLPYVLLGELFPTNVKAAAVSLGTLYGSFAGFLMAKFFKPLAVSIGVYSVFYIFSGVCFVGALFVFFFLPETKGKNFQEIQELLNRRRKKIKIPH